MLDQYSNDSVTLDSYYGAENGLNFIQNDDLQGQTENDFDSPHFNGSGGMESHRNAEYQEALAESQRIKQQIDSFMAMDLNSQSRNSPPTGINKYFDEFENSLIEKEIDGGPTLRPTAGEFIPANKPFVPYGQNQGYGSIQNSPGNYQDQSFNQLGGNMPGQFGNGAPRMPLMSQHKPRFTPTPHQIQKHKAIAEQQMLAQQQYQQQFGNGSRPMQGGYQQQQQFGPQGFNRGGQQQYGMNQGYNQQQQQGGGGVQYVNGQYVNRPQPQYQQQQFGGMNGGYQQQQMMPPRMQQFNQPIPQKVGQYSQNQQNMQQLVAQQLLSQPQHQQLQSSSQYNQPFPQGPPLPPTGPSVTFGATSKPRLPHPPTVNKNTVFFMVQFKLEFRYFVTSPHVIEEVGLNDFVIVECDKGGEDLGLVVECMQLIQYTERRTKEKQSGLFNEDERSLRYILKVANQFDLALLPEKYHDETVVVEHTTEVVKHILMLPMQIIAAEYQFDRTKLFIYYTANTRVDFRELVSKLFSIFKTCIWLKKMNTNLSFDAKRHAVLALRTGSLILPPNASSKQIPNNAGIITLRSGCDSEDEGEN